MELSNRRIELIYCADSNPQIAQVAIMNGFTYGAQIPGTIYFPVDFIDQNWKDPNRRKYMTFARINNPRIATVLDLESPEQFDLVMEWAYEMSNYVSEAVVVIPKYSGAISQLPRTVNDIPIRLGYSVPTSYGATLVDLSEFDGWDVHLLGGSPSMQIELAHKMNVVSIDCNYMFKIAMYKKYYYKGKFYEERKNSLVKTFDISCHNIIQDWKDNGFIIEEKYNKDYALDYKHKRNIRLKMG